jgi:hypothetical protein
MQKVTNNVAINYLIDFNTKFYVSLEIISFEYCRLSKSYILKLIYKYCIISANKN